MSATTLQTLPVGTAVGGQCVIERHLRNGVMTEVYRARREGSGRERFEVRRFTLVASSDALRAVRRGLDRIQALGLTAVPALVDVIDDPVGLLVVTTTATEGATSLRMTLDAAGSLEPAECVRLVRTIADVLDVLHGTSPQVLHRRLSPDTITLIGAQREVRVEECGLAQALVDAGLVNARVPLQARQYLSPDELLQRPSPRGDTFALASVAFECLAGRPAFLGATEASLSAAILRGVRPALHALRADIPAAVDAVLARAWSADASKGFPSAAALADAFATALGPLAAAPAARPEPQQGSPPAGAPVLSSSELNLMKATILGVGGPARPVVPAPRAKAPESETTPAAPLTPVRSRIVGGRPQMPTQKVEVPRIHPPGTERVGEEAERPTFPPARLPPAAPAPVASPSGGAISADLFNIADIEGLDIPLAPEGSPVSGPPMGRASSVPPPVPPSVPRVPSRSATILRSSVPPPVSAPPPTPPTPSVELTFEMDADVSVGTDDELSADTWEVPPAPPRPPSMPALPHVATSAPPAPASSVEPPAAPPDEPSIPAFTIPVDAAPSWPPPAPPPAPLPPPMVAPAPAIETVAVSPAPPAHFDAPAPAASAPPPSAASAGLSRWAIIGTSLVAAAAIVTGGQIYLARMSRPPSPPVAAVRVTAPAVAPPVVAPPVVDASAQASADVVAAPPAMDADATVTDVVAISVDAATPAVDAATSPPDVTAAAPATGAVGWDVEVFGASNDPPREHPRRRDMGHLEGALEAEIRRCVGPGSSRHVRMSVVYEGASGRPRELRIVGNFAQPPVGTCLENVVRSHPVPPFTDAEFESNFVFSTTDEEE